MWKYLSPSYDLYSDQTLSSLKRYFNEARAALGERLFLDLFFQVENDDYLADLSELNRNSFLDELHNAKDLLGMYQIFY